MSTRQQVLHGECAVVSSEMHVTRFREKFAKSERIEALKGSEYLRTVFRYGRYKFMRK